MQITINMPIVTECSIKECSYNNDNGCHAKAITIGDGQTPACDTLFNGSKLAINTSIHAGVGACKISNCSFNTDLECTADAVSIGMQGISVQCMTYTPR